MTPADEQQPCATNEVDPATGYPRALAEIIALFAELPDDGKRESLIAYADMAPQQQPREGERFDLEDVRKDEECTDTVGIFLRVDDGGRAFFRVTLGPQVQTLTRAMTAILCEGLNGARTEVIEAVPADFVPRIVGGQLVRVRSQTVYYVLSRMKGAVGAYRKRQRAQG